MRVNKITIALGLTSAIVLAGCNDGGSSSSTTPSSTTYSVKAIDGYLRNAKVWLDINRNFVHDEATEPSAITGEGGVAELDVTGIENYQNYQLVVHAIAGQTVDEDTIDVNNTDGVVMQGSMILSAPAGESNVTPLSSFVNVLMNKDPSALNDPEQVEQLKQQAAQEAAQQLGLSPDTLFEDYLAEGTEDPKATFAAQSIVQSEQILPETPEEMAELAQDIQDAGEDASQDVPELMIADAITDQIKQVIEQTDPDDLEDTPVPVTPPEDNTPPADNDEDGVPNELDAFPDDSTEWLDSDNDGTGNNEDLFDDDPSEQHDTDGDSIGNNADTDDDDDGVDDNFDDFPLDDTKAGDPDNDGVDTLIDAFPQDETKSVADEVLSNSAYVATLNINHREVMMLNVDIEKQIETFNDNSVKTTTSTTYTTNDNVLYGQKESVDIYLNGEFTRIETFSYDFNLDEDAQFVGKTLDIGTRTDSQESYWRYVDESAAAPEGGVNGDTVRVFDDVDFSARSHPTDLSQIDTIQHFEVAMNQESDVTTFTTDFNQYVVDGFELNDESTHNKDYASHNITEEENLIQIAVRDEQDWNANGTVNTIFDFNTDLGSGYGLSIEQPIWANPTDGVNEEYADFNFTQGNWDNLTSYWYHYDRDMTVSGITIETGSRSILDVSLGEDGEPLNQESSELPFHDWVAITKPISDTEMTKTIRWSHNPLDGYDFTASVSDIGQAYRVMQKQTNGLWVTYSFDEWGSTSVTNLEELVETARSEGTPLDQIEIEGLSRSGAILPNGSFQYDDQGNPIQWYAVTQEPRLTDGTPTLVPLTLDPDGVLPGAYIMNVGVDMILVAPMVEEPHPWFNDYYRQMINTYAIDLDPNAFSWSTTLGQLFLDESAAQSRLDEILDPDYRICTSENTGERTDPADGYWDFVGAAYNCGYMGIDSSYLDDLTLYYQEDEQSHFSYQFNTDGSGTYLESNGYSDTFSWTITESGIIRIDNGGDLEHFAYIADEEGKYSMLALFQWQENGQDISEIIGMEMTVYAPSQSEYKVCTLGDTEWDEVNDKPASSPVYADLEQAAQDCGGATPFTTEMINGLVWHDYNAEKDRHKIWTFHADGTVTKTKNGVMSGPFTWIIDENGYLKIIYDVSNPDDFIIFALIATEDDKFSLKALDSYPEQVDGQVEIWSEIVTEEFVTTNPVDKSAVIAAITEQVDWFSPWAERNEDEQKDYLYFDNLDMPQSEHLTWATSSVVNSDKSISPVDITDDSDLLLTGEGWTEVTGFEFTLTDSDITGAAPTAPGLTYSIIYAAVHDKQGENIAAEAPGDWTHYYSDTETYPTGSQAVSLTMRNDTDNYYLLDWRPYHMLGEPGVDNDSDQIASLGELFVSSSAGEGTPGDELDSTSIGHEVSVELVRSNSSDTSGVANFFTVNWHENSATLLASGQWELRDINNEQLVLFEIPQSIIDSYGNVIDSKWMFYSLYRSQTGGDDLVHVGELYEARTEFEEVYLYNSTAKEAIINAADIQ